MKTEIRRTPMEVGMAVVCAGVKAGRKAVELTDGTQPFISLLPPGFRVGPVDGLANRFPGGPQVDRFALLSAVPGGVFVHTRQFKLSPHENFGRTSDETGVATAPRPDSAVVTHTRKIKI
jgi:hypothetical protein